jgi:hypothetical protein
MDEVVKAVDETWNPDDPSRPANMSFRGSDDFLRAKVRATSIAVSAG